MGRPAVSAPPEPLSSARNTRRSPRLYGRHPNIPYKVLVAELTVRTTLDVFTLCMLHMRSVTSTRLIKAFKMDNL